MVFRRLSIPDVLLIEPEKLADNRGYFSETFREERFVEQGLPIRYIQENLSHSRQSSTLRGLHFQKPPHSQDKLVRVIRGSILDVAVDIRQGSPSYGRFVTATVSEQNGCQIFVPKGFAHGFVTLEPDTAVLYKVTHYYAPGSDTGLCWSDPDLAIDWNLAADPILSAKDQSLPPFRELPAGLFPYGPY